MNNPTIYSAAGNGVVKADQHGELVLLSDYLELKRQYDILDKKEEVQYRLRGALAEELKKAKAEIAELRGQPDPLTAYLYAAELCKDDIKTLKDEVKRLRKASEWQPIETAPKDGKTIILVVEYGYVYTGIFHNDGYCQDLTGAGLDPTHWMHLPQPPKQEDKQS